MENKVQVLLSVMNIKSKKQYEELLNENKIVGNVIAVNQIEDKQELFNIDQGHQKIYSYHEKGASKSRNRLLENATGDICIFADDDTIYVENYEKIIKEEYAKNPKADMIIFWAENANSKREKIKKIGNKKINYLDIMKIRTYEISTKKETLEKLKNANIKFDINFGPTGVFSKGEETIFMSEILKSGINIYSTTKKIATVSHNKSTWFKGYNEKFLYDQGAIFYKIAPKWYYILILQYVVRKYSLYKNNLNIIQAYKQLALGAKKCKKIESFTN